MQGTTGGRGELPSDDYGDLSDDGSLGFQARHAIPGSPGLGRQLGRPLQGLKAMEETCDALQAEVNTLQDELETLRDDYGHLLLYNMELRRQIVNAGGIARSSEQRLIQEGGMSRVVLLHQTAIGPGSVAQNKDYGVLQEGPVARVMASMGPGPGEAGPSAGPPAKLHRTLNDGGGGGGGGETWVLQPALAQQPEEKPQLSAAGFPYGTSLVSAALQQPGGYGQIGFSGLNMGTLGGQQQGNMLQVGSMSLAQDSSGQQRMLLLPNTAQAGFNHLTLQGSAPALAAGSLGSSMPMFQAAGSTMHGTFLHQDNSNAQARPAAGQLFGAISGAQPQGRTLLLNQTPDQLLLQRQQLQQQLGIQQQQLQTLRTLQSNQQMGGNNGGGTGDM